MTPAQEHAAKIAFTQEHLRGRTEVAICEFNRQTGACRVLTLDDLPPSLREEIAEILPDTQNHFCSHPEHAHEDHGLAAIWINVDGLNKAAEPAGEN